MGQIRVLGLSPTGKVPAALFAVNKGVGRVSSSQIPKYLLCIGNKTSGGTATADTEVFDVFPNTDLDAKVGARSELRWMLHLAQKYPGIRIKGLACTEAAGGVAAACTITFATNATSAGTWLYYVAGEEVSVVIASGDTPSQQATKVVTAFGQNLNLPCTAGASGAVVTLTWANVGTRGNDATLYQDVSLKPGASTSTLATASSYSVTAGPNGVTGVRFGGGTGTDSLTNALATLAGDQYFTIAAAHVDSTNLGLLETYRGEKAAIGSQIYEQICLGQNGVYATAQTAAKTNLNADGFSVVWHRGSEATPAMLAASYGAMRHQKEQSHPNRRFNGDVLLGIPPQRASGDRPSPGDSGEQQTALDNGVTPATTSAEGKAVVVRAINTLCTRSSVPFYGVLDCGESRAPDAIAEECILAWNTEYAVNNEWVNSDPAKGEPARPTQVATPQFLASYLKGICAAKIQDKWIASVSVSAEYDPDSDMILCQVDCEVMPLNHRLGGNINSTI
jgi:phage tail sheath gpL-like